jgi:ubiquinone biosynthesis protein UbiJ
MKKGQMSLDGESQFDSQLSQLLQLVNAQPVEL